MPSVSHCRQQPRLGERHVAAGSAARRPGDVQSLDPEDIAAYLTEQLAQLPQEKSLYADWLAISVEPSVVMRWIDDKVAKEWGPHAASRASHIIAEGFDGDVEPAHNLKPHQLSISAKFAVPGAPVQPMPYKPATTGSGAQTQG